MKFQSHTVRPDGKVQMVELPGADSLASWKRAWAVFKTASIMEGIATAAVLDRYEAKFEARCGRYPKSWHICARADIRCRSELWGRERVRLEIFHLAHPELSAFDPAIPWNAVIKSSVECYDFWDEELKEPALAFENQSGRSAPPPPPAVGDDRKPLQRKRPAPDTQTDYRRGDGRYTHSVDGVQICYKYNREAGGCSDAGCTAVPPRAHVCEFCRGQHRAITCKPDWVPPPPGVRPAPKRKGRRT